MLYAMGDLHLSLSVDKKMDIFGNGWQGYEQKLRQNLQILTENDTLILCGDSSWGLNLNEALEDLRFIHSLPGEKILIKGNHDYFWETKAKLERFFNEHDLPSLRILHNNAYLAEDVLLCGTRGWGEPLDDKIRNREIGRMRKSLEEGRKLSAVAPIYVFLHYPPIIGDTALVEYPAIFAEFDVKACFYGHLHGYARGKAFEGERDGVVYRLISADHLDFTPIAL